MLTIAGGILLAVALLVGLAAAALAVVGGAQALFVRPAIFWSALFVAAILAASAL